MNLRQLLTIFATCFASAPVLSFEAAYAQTDEQLARALIDAYPGHLSGFDGTNLIWTDGTKMPFSDGAERKSTDDLVNNPSIKDMFKWRYVFGGKGIPAKEGVDPGRIRNGAFFEKMYGGCKGKAGSPCDNLMCASKRKLVSVSWAPSMHGGTMRASTVNGVDKQLEKVSEELEKLGPSYKKYLSPNGGSYNARCIAGTSRISVHSYGIAFDMNTAYGKYWQYGLAKGITEARFEKMNQPLIYKNKLPLAIVKVFETHGFIWGGSWYHFDGMHFEYRPEFKALEAILTKSKAS